MPVGAPIMEVRDVTKVYPPRLQALRGVTLAVNEGEVLALLGANGAGKSTLARILTGVEPQTSGTMALRGEAIQIDSPSAANRLGVAAVHQELPLLPNLTAAENLTLGHADEGLWSVFRQRRAVARYRELAGAVPDPPPPDALVRDLTVAARQKVGFLRALSLDPQVLIVDEGTSSVSTEERQQLYGLLRELAASRGMGVVYITHFIDDVMAASDRVVVLRDGTVALEAATASLRPDDILEVLSGGARTPAAPAVSATAEARPRLEGAGLDVRGLRCGGAPALDLAVAPGECVGLYGPPGCGAPELLRAMAGLDVHGGTLTWNGRRLPARATVRAKANIAYCSGDRAQNLMLPWTVEANIGLSHLFRGSALRWVDRSALRDRAQRIVSDFRIVGGPDDVIRNLSGGNQQRVVVARAAMLGRPLLLLGDDLTRGVDVVGRAEIHAILRETVEQGASMVLYSTDPEEIVSLCTRVLVLADGVVTHQLQGDAVDVLSLETGGRLRQAAAPAPSDDHERTIWRSTHEQ
jgi:ABC-type sugar transport system ATPase subunit